MANGVAKFNKVVDVAFEDFLQMKRTYRFELKGFSGSSGGYVRSLKNLFYSTMNKSLRETTRKLLRAVIFENVVSNSSELPMIFAIGTMGADSFQVLTNFLPAIVLRDLFHKFYDRKLCKQFIENIRNDREYLLFNIGERNLYLMKIYGRLCSALLNDFVGEQLRGGDTSFYVKNASFSGAMKMVRFYKRLKKLKRIISINKPEDSHAPFVAEVKDDYLGIRFIIGKGEKWIKLKESIKEINGMEKIASDFHNPDWFYQNIRSFEWELWINRNRLRKAGYRGLVFLAFVWFHLANSYIVKLSEIDNYTRLAGFSQCESISGDSIFFVDDLDDIDRVVKANL